MDRGALRCPAPEGGEASLVRAPVSLPGIAANRAQTVPDTASVGPVLPLEQASGAADGPRDKAQISLFFVFQPPSLRPHLFPQGHIPFTLFTHVQPPGLLYCLRGGRMSSLQAQLLPSFPG